MPQTILALFAVMLTSMFALQQSRQAIRVQMNVVQRETQTQARGVASEVFAEIASFAFDENTKNATGVVPPSGMTPEPFSTNKLFADADDVDDVHGMTPHLVTRDVTAPDGSLATLTFEVTATVDYAYFVVEGGEQKMKPTPDDSQTNHKLVVLSVRCLDLAGTPWDDPHFSLRLARPFSYAPAEF